MKVNNTIALTHGMDGNLLLEVAGQKRVIDSSHESYELVSSMYRALRQLSPPNRVGYFSNQKDLEKALYDICGIPYMDMEEEIKIPQASAEELVEQGLDGLLAFFKEFEFEPNFRFVNSFALALQKSEKVAKEYVINYFKLVDSSYTKEVVSKMKSVEWKEICEHIVKLSPKSIINNRFKIYYGSAGTGKTTLAQKETAGRCVICNNSMLPADLMEDFVFVNGQPSFRPSMLWRCMEEGTPITLDEINLLPFEALRFLQGILDGKKEFTYKGNLIHIADGFQVIGTMNLIVNGAVFNLPEPLVDRASEMKEFKLTAKQLLSAIV